jgi:hypothetical protein
VLVDTSNVLRHGPSPSTCRRYELHPMLVLMSKRFPKAHPPILKYELYSTSWKNEMDSYYPRV